MEPGCPNCGSSLLRTGECAVCTGGGRVATTDTMKRVDRYVMRSPGDAVASKNMSAGSAQLVVFGTGQVYALPPKRSRIGREKDNEILIANDTCVSRHHAIILFADGSYWLEDLHSTNGTLLNGKTVRGRWRLHPGDRVSVGKTEFMFELALPSNELGSYDLIAQLGRGGMGIVYKARDQHNQRIVAIKQLNLASVEPSRQRAKQERFKREATTAARLDHPNIVSVYSVETVGETDYYVMEFLEGHSLCRELELKGGHLSAEEFLPILEQVAGALAYAHSERIVHRDVKPPNIFVLNDGRVKLTDFGIAALLDVDHTKLTRSGSLLGTPAYLSPEQLQDPRQVDHRADIYSLGVVTYQVLSGHLPFEAQGLAALAMKVATEREVPLDRISASVNARTAAVVAKAMEKKPADRYQSALDYLWDFRRSLTPTSLDETLESLLSSEYKRATTSQETTGPREAVPSPAAESSGWQSRQAPVISLIEDTPCLDGEHPSDHSTPPPESAAPVEEHTAPAADAAVRVEEHAAPAADAAVRVEEHAAPAADAAVRVEEHAAPATDAAVFSLEETSPQDPQPEPIAFESPESSPIDITLVSVPLVASLMKPIGAFGRFGRGSSCFIDPYAVCYGTDLVVVSDLATRAIQIFTSEGRWIANVKQPGDGPPAPISPSNPTRVAGLAFNSANEILACHSAEHAIRVFDTGGNLVRELNIAEDVGIASLCCDGHGLLYAADAINGCVHVFDADEKTPVRKIGRTKRLKLKVPAFLAIDHRNQVFVVDIGTATISVFDQDGTLIRSFGGPQTPSGMLMVPTGIAVSTNDLVYVSDSLNNCVQVFGPDGVPLYSFGSTGSELGEFIQPAGLTIDNNAGILYVADRGNHRIQMMELLKK